MIHLKIFCPYERVITIARKRMNEGITFSADFYQNGSHFARREALASRPFDTNLKFGEDDRKRFLESEMLAKITFADGKQWNVVVRNTLKTNSHPLVQTPGNGHDATHPSGDILPICYPEARLTLPEIGDVRPMSELIQVPRGDYSRPFFCYLDAGFDALSNTLYVDGPDMSEREVLFYAKQLRLDNVVYDILSSAPLAPVELASDVVHGGSAQEIKRWQIILTGDYGDMSWRLSQSFGYKNGVVLDPWSLLQLFRLAALLDDVVFTSKVISVDPASRKVTIPIVPRGTSFALNSDVANELALLLDRNAAIADLSALRVVDDALGFFVGENYAYITRSARASSCFAFAWSELIARSLGRPDVGLILRIMIASVKEGAFVIMDDHTLLGVTASEKPFTLSFMDRGAPRRVVVRRRTVREVPVGLFLLGFDPLDNKVKNTPDHWIVARGFINGAITCVSDSYALNVIEPGSDITDAVRNSADTVFAVVEVTQDGRVCPSEDAYVTPS